MGNKNAAKSGNKAPRTDGPKTIPAIISPITEGCPIFASSIPKILDVIKITMS